ncbi:amidohydrolase family protein [Bosea sp. TND4EK4]|uniref:amidohydrolase family protein n=1 Tax=Bosea sp. TND4EK4 TaxID=1907408 RepID=UPI000957111B|nr:amidohydrolase family protein [Bosea sp. TND4EK4]SIQ61506.1 L-fuconolactonase [Bosea sp. TND4EK4]
MTAPANRAPRIDSHQHLWRLARGDYGWLTPGLAPLYRDFTPADLAPLLAAGGIDATLLVQAAPTEAETRFLLETAAGTPFVAGVVGWADFEAPGAPARIAALAADPLLVGLRPMVQDLPDPDWLARPGLAPAFAAMRQHGLVFDALVKPPQIPALLALLERETERPVVLDHGAKPDLIRGDLAGWRAGIAAIAARPNTICKLSGLVTEAAPDWSLETLKPAFDHLLACFGPQRLLFGSDWPVVTLRAPYRRWLEAAERLTETLSAGEKAAIFGGTAERVYLERRGRKPWRA